MVKRIRVDRKSHTARRHMKTWTRTNPKTGKKITMHKRVGEWNVSRSKHLTEDRGAPGKTPKKDQWFKPRGHLGGWQKSLDTVTRRRRALGSTPKNWSKKKRYNSAAKKLQALANATADKTTKRLAGSDADYFREKLYGQNPHFTPIQKKMIITDMEENSNMGRSVDHTFRSFELAHRGAEDELRAQGAAVTARNVESHMKRRFGFVDTQHGSTVEEEAA